MSYHLKEGQEIEWPNNLLHAVGIDDDLINNSCEDRLVQMLSSSMFMERESYAVIRHFKDHASFEEIAEELFISEEAARSLVRKVVMRLSRPETIPMILFGSIYGPPAPGKKVPTLSIDPSTVLIRELDLPSRADAALRRAGVETVQDLINLGPRVRQLYGLGTKYFVTISERTSRTLGVDSLESLWGVDFSHAREGSR